MYQGLGQMLTMRLQHHQGCSEVPKCAYVIYGQPLNSVLNVKALAGAFNQEKALEGAISVITNLRMDLF